MSEFKLFTGKIDATRKLKKADDSGYKYRNSMGKNVALTHDEFQELCDYYVAYILKVLFLRNRAADHYRWVKEPTLKEKRLAARCNGYRDPARKAAYAVALKQAKASALVREQNLAPDAEMPGKSAVRITMTVRGAAWFREYCNWHINTTGKPYWYEPTRDQYVDDDNLDKDESTPKFPVYALKDLHIHS